MHRGPPSGQMQRKPKWSEALHICATAVLILACVLWCIHMYYVLASVQVQKVWWALYKCICTKAGPELVSKNSISTSMQHHTRVSQHCTLAFLIQNQIILFKFSHDLPPFLSSTLVFTNLTFLTCLFSQWEGTGNTKSLFLLQKEKWSASQIKGLAQCL